ncbi:MAG: twin-arginine translocase TatA/TatE family subunit [Planctomycetes bacterium]|nr:twin-arginine translocase TatA/TatE family subunit [Planctomycetota bacterium]
MIPVHPPTAFLMPSTGEWLLILLVGVLVYGRNLPDVGRRLGHTLAHLRRGFEDFKRDMDRDPSLRDARSGLGEIKRTLDSTKRLVDPRRMIDDFTRVPPRDDFVPPPPAAIDEQPREEARRNEPPQV